MKRFRVEWMHNGNWRMDDDSTGTFTTKEKALEYEIQIKASSTGELVTRIVEVA